jgi:hypothetical protein
VAKTTEAKTKMTKEEATLFILKVLKSTMAIMSKPTKDQALDLAKQHNVTVEELLNKAQEIAYKI